MVYRSTEILVLLAISAFIAGCAPLTHTLRVDMRGPSVSGMDLNRKTISVMANVQGTSDADSVFMAALCDGFATRLQKEYFGGENIIGIYSVKTPKDSDPFLSKDSLFRFAMESGDDVVFALSGPCIGTIQYYAPVASGNSAPDSAYTVRAKVPYELYVSAYDTMDKADKVYTFSGSRTLNATFYCSNEENDEELRSRLLSSMTFEAGRLGSVAASNFLSTWKQDSYSFYYYGNGAWLDIAEILAYDYDWRKAMDGWLKLLNTKNVQKKACAEYNIALACHMLGMQQLASEWLDRADSHFSLSLSDGLRKRINRMK